MSPQSLPPRDGGDRHNAPCDPPPTPPQSPSVMEEPIYIQAPIDVGAWVVVLELFQESTVLEGRGLSGCRLGACTSKWTPTVRRKYYIGVRSFLFFLASVIAKFKESNSLI